MDIRCINAENYKLTVGRTYQAEPDGRDFYKLLNDNNIGVRYHRRLFENLPATAAGRPQSAPARPATPPPPPPRTERDLVQSIAIRNGQIVFTDFDRNVKVIENQFIKRNTEISCGVAQISGINGQINHIDDFFDLDNDDYITIRKALFKKSLEHYVMTEQLSDRAFGLLSTNITGGDEDLLTVLDDLAVSATDAENNPNSGNLIKIWVLARAE
jgi:hypothetical protein